MQVQTTTHPVEIYTAHYTIGGLMEPIGNFAAYINDPIISAFRITDATLLPIMYRARLGEMKLPELYVMRSEIHVFLVGDFSPRDANLLPRRHALVCMTSAFAVRGVFYAGQEFREAQVFDPPGPFFPATNIDIYNLRTLMTEVNGSADLAFVNKMHISAYHPAAR